jgi:hypothetical protein
VSRFWIRPRSQLPDNLQASPEFVRKEWSSNIGTAPPAWIESDHDTVFWAVETLQYTVRIATHCAKKPANLSAVRCAFIHGLHLLIAIPQATDLLNWAHRMTVNPFFL